MASESGASPETPGTRDETAETTAGDRRRTQDMTGSASAHVQAPLRVPAVSVMRPHLELDAGAVEDLISAAYETHRRDLYSLALRATRDPETAADLVQEAYVRLVREVRGGRVPENVRAWLYRVVTNLITTRWRRAGVADRFKALFITGTAPDDPEAEYIRREAATELHRALDTLSVEARVALLLAAQGLSGREVAAAIGRNEGATRTLMCRARMALKDRLHDGEPTR
jgi:RNA polymerase sigma-70 factor (ECF subfamily)